MEIPLGRTMRIWFWRCRSECGAANVRELPGGTKGGELLNCECRICGARSRMVVAPAATAPDRRRTPRSPLDSPTPSPSGPRKGRARDSLASPGTADAVVVIDDRSLVTYWGTGAVRLYGLQPREAVGRPLRDCYGIRWNRPEDEAAALARLTARGVVTGENTHILHSGQELPVEWEVSVLRDALKRRIGLLAAIRPKPSA